MDSFATAVSLALQYGVPLDVLCAKFTHVRFEPSGWSGNPKIGYPSLTREMVEYAAIYATTHPRRGRPPAQPWSGRKPVGRK
jgi:hypothetical protein